MQPLALQSIGLKGRILPYCMRNAQRGCWATLWEFHPRMPVGESLLSQLQPGWDLPSDWVQNSRDLTQGHLLSLDSETCARKGFPASGPRLDKSRLGTIDQIATGAMTAEIKANSQLMHLWELSCLAIAFSRALIGWGSCTISFTCRTSALNTLKSLPTRLGLGPSSGQG